MEPKERGIRANNLSPVPIAASIIDGQLKTKEAVGKQLVLIIYPPVRFGSVDNNGLIEKARFAGDSLGAVGIG